MVGKRVLRWMVEQVMDLSPGELQIPSPKSLYRLWDDPTTSQSVSTVLTDREMRSVDHRPGGHQHEHSL